MASSQTMGLSLQAFLSMMKERIDENHPWVMMDSIRSSVVGESGWQTFSPPLGLTYLIFFGNDRRTTIVRRSYGSLVKSRASFDGRKANPMLSVISKERYQIHVLK